MTPGVLFNFGMQVFCLYSGIDTTKTNGNLFESSPDLPLKPRPIVRPAKIVVYNNIATTIFVIFNGRVAYLSTV